MTPILRKQNEMSNEADLPRDSQAAESGKGGLEKRWILVCLHDGPRRLKCVNVEVTRPSASWDWLPELVPTALVTLTISGSLNIIHGVGDEGEVVPAALGRCFRSCVP